MGTSDIEVYVTESNCIFHLLNRTTTDLEKLLVQLISSRRAVDEMSTSIANMMPYFANVEAYEKGQLRIEKNMGQFICMKTM